MEDMYAVLQFINIVVLRVHAGVPSHPFVLRRAPRELVLLEGGSLVAKLRRLGGRPGFRTARILDLLPTPATQMHRSGAEMASGNQKRLTRWSSFCNCLIHYMYFEKSHYDIVVLHPASPAFLSSP